MLPLFVLKIALVFLIRHIGRRSDIASFVGVIVAAAFITENFFKAVISGSRDLPDSPKIAPHRLSTPRQPFPPPTRSRETSPHSCGTRWVCRSYQVPASGFALCAGLLCRHLCCRRRRWVRLLLRCSYRAGCQAFLHCSLIKNMSRLVRSAQKDLFC